MMAPIFVTSLVVLAASSPWESERRKEISMRKRRQNFITFLQVMKGKAIMRLLIITFTQKGNKRTQKQKSLLNLNYSNYYIRTWLDNIQYTKKRVRENEDWLVLILFKISATNVGIEFLVFSVFNFGPLTRLIQSSKEKKKKKKLDSVCRERWHHGRCYFDLWCRRKYITE